MIFNLISIISQVIILNLNAVYNLEIGENITTVTNNIDADRTSINIIENNSNTSSGNLAPELIEYYELDDDILLHSSSSKPPTSSLTISSSTSSSSSFSTLPSSSPAAVTSSISATASVSTAAVSSSSISATLVPDIYPDPEEVNRKIKILNINNIMHKSLQISKNSDINDIDFKGRDLIDNIMYIYYGSNNSSKNSLGSSIVIGGSVLALTAQILCSILMILRNRRLRRQNTLFTVFFNLVAILLLSNLIFVIGVQANKSEFRCGMVAILLHYCHLSTSIWALIYIFIMYDYIVNDSGINLKYDYFIAYGAPAIYVLFSCAISSTSYEIVQYCWMSVQRGMIINFMIPVSAIIVASTVLGTLCLREIASKQREVIAESIENILENAAKSHEHLNSANIVETDKYCDSEEKIVDNYKKSNDLYDSKFDLGVLSIVDLSLQSSADTQDFTDFKRAIKFWLFFQPMFAICWFFGAVALENRQSCTMPIVFVICYNLMNWYLLIRSPYICPIIQDQYQTEKFRANQNVLEDNNHQSVCNDTIPLLCAGTALQTNLKTDTNISIEENMSVFRHISTNNWSDSLGDVSANLDSITTISN